MAVIKLSAFSGEQPRVIPRLMPPTAAQTAVNTRLDDGGLTPMRKPAQVFAAGEFDWQSIYFHQGTWLGWPTTVHASPGPVAQDRLYYTGDGVPKMLVGGTVYALALPPPAGALTAALDGSGSGDVSSRLYVYTWVTSFGEESEPNPVSNEVAWQPGYDVILSGFAATPPGRAITHQRIYRSQTGQQGTYFYLIAERAASTGNFTDNIAVDAFQEPLPSASWNPPPDTLAGLIALPNGIMAAFAGRNLYFSEPWRPHAWPEKYVLTTDSAIVGLGAIGNSVIVMTEAQPYIVDGSTPDTMRMTKLELNLPCVNGRSIVDLGYAIAYASHEGLVVVRSDGSFSIATTNIFHRNDWLALSPSTMLGGQFMGRYVAFYDTTDENGAPLKGALLIDISSASFLIRSTVTAKAAFFDIVSGSLYYRPELEKQIYQFDPPLAAPQVQFWKSKQFVLPRPVSFGVIRVDAAGAPGTIGLEELIEAIEAANAALIAAGSIGGDIAAEPIGMLSVAGDWLELLPGGSAVLLVGIYADGVKIATVTLANRAVRLPADSLARVWEIDVTSDLQVQEIVMAQTMDELRATP